MLRLTRCSLTISASASRPKPTQKYKPGKKEWTYPYQGSLVPDAFSSEDIDDADDEYVQEWHFPYPGQKECSVTDPSTLVRAFMAWVPGDRFQKRRATYSRQVQGRFKAG